MHTFYYISHFFTQFSWKKVHDHFKLAHLIIILESHWSRLLHQLFHPWWHAFNTTLMFFFSFHCIVFKVRTLITERSFLHSVCIFFWKRVKAKLYLLYFVLVTQTKYLAIYEAEGEMYSFSLCLFQSVETMFPGLLLKTSSGSCQMFTTPSCATSANSWLWWRGIR